MDQYQLHNCSAVSIAKIFINNMLPAAEYLVYNKTISNNEYIENWENVQELTLIVIKNMHEWISIS